MFKGNPNLAVGVFVSTALAILAAFAIWLAGTKGNEPMQSYSMLFERDVSGLSLGGPVYFMGVSVGRVSDMELLPGDPVRVRVDIEVRANTPVDRGTFASLVSQGITGVNVINLSAEPGAYPPIGESDGFEHPLIPVRQTGLSAMLAQAPDTISKLNALLDQANELLGPENRATISQALKDVTTLTGSLAAESANLQALPGEMRSVLADVRSLSGQINSSLQQLQPELMATLGHTRETAANLEQLTDSLERWLADNETELQHFIDQGLGQAPDLIYDLRNAVRELQKFLHQLQDDPSQLIHRPPNEALSVEP